MHDTWCTSAVVVVPHYLNKTDGGDLETGAKSSPLSIWLGTPNSFQLREMSREAADVVLPTCAFHLGGMSLRVAGLCPLPSSRDTLVPHNPRRSMAFLPIFPRTKTRELFGEGSSTAPEGRRPPVPTGFGGVSWPKGSCLFPFHRVIRFKRGCRVGSLVQGSGARDVTGMASFPNDCDPCVVRRELVKVREAFSRRSFSRPRAYSTQCSRTMCSLGATNVSQIYRRILPNSGA